jgi:hypothetical protein
MLMVMTILVLRRQNLLVYITSFNFPLGKSTTFVTLGSGQSITIYSENWKC